MKKLLIAVLAMFPFLAFGSNWVKVASSDDNIFFVDADSLQKSGNTVTFWQKRNYKKRDKFGDLSAKINVIVNCKTKETKNLYLLFYDDLDNYGTPTSSFAGQQGWGPIAPDTVAEIVMKYVCK